MAARVGLAPTPRGLTGRHATFTLPGNLNLELPARLALASVRLEDERLIYFGHGSIRMRSAEFKNWSARQELHLRSLGPRPSVLLLHYALLAPALLWTPEQENARPSTLEIVSRQDSLNWRTRRELHPQPSRRQRGALLVELRVRKWWEVLVTLQFVASDTYL